MFFINYRVYWSITNQTVLKCLKKKKKKKASTISSIIVYLINMARNYLYARWLFFQSRFSARKIWPISIIFGILNKEWSNFKKLLFIFL